MTRGGHDLVVCGGGSAGMACAITAADEGARVLVLERAAEIGGTLHWAGGHLSGAGTRRQRERGIDDHPDLHYADVMDISNGTANPELVRLAVDEAPGAIDWLDGLGWRHAPESPATSVFLKPYQVERVHWGAGDVAQTGPVILEALLPAWEAHVAAGRIECLLGHRVTALLPGDGDGDGDGDGAGAGGVAGVRAERAADGAVVELRGGAVVLATGGYAANPALFAELTPGAPSVLALALPGATGDGILAAREQGAAVVMADRFLLNHGILEEEPGSERGAARLAGIDLAPERPRRSEIWVNAAGERFVAEDRRSILGLHAALAAQPGQRAWVVTDAAGLREAPPWHAGADPQDVLGRGVQADTAEQLARLAGIDPQGLARTIAAWNEACAAGSDPQGRRADSLHPLAEAPLFAVLMRAAATLSFGGLAVDRDLRVLRENGEPIPGLYAAGEIIGAAQTSGQSYAGGMLLTPALAFGRKIGRTLGGAAAAARASA